MTKMDRQPDRHCPCFREPEFHLEEPPRLAAVCRLVSPIRHVSPQSMARSNHAQTAALPLNFSFRTMSHRPWLFPQGGKLSETGLLHSIFMSTTTKIGMLNRSPRHEPTHTHRSHASRHCMARSRASYSTCMYTGACTLYSIAAAGKLVY